jgi:predicted aspartyl protease
VKAPRLLLTAALIAAALSSAPSPLPPRSAVGLGADPYAQLARLFRERRYFELRDAVALMDGLSGPAPDFYRGAVDLVFNRLDSAVERLRACLEGDSGAGDGASLRPSAKEAWGLLADAFRKSGRYRESAEAQRTILDRFAGELDPDEKASRENQTVLWSALADVPPQTVEIRGDSAVSMDERQIPVRIKNRVLYFSYDTGANLSILFVTAADQLGLVRRGPKTTIQSSTGKWIEARLTVIPELRLGEAVVRNAVFLVMPEEFFPGRRVRPGVEYRGILGAPILAGLGEFSETRDGRFIIPAAPPARPESNMCFFGFMPITEVVYQGARLLFLLDTGASSTVLHPPFYRRYGAGLQDRSPLTALTMGGVGDLRRINVHILDEFSFRAGGRGLSLWKVAVQTQVTNALTDCFCGTLGLDILDQCSRLTINFKSMSFLLE